MSRRWFVVTAIAVASVFVVAQIARAGEPLGLDQGLFACFGRWIRDGWLPYRDMFDSKPPLHLYTWVLAWAGGSTASAWVFEAIWLGISLVLAFFVVRRWWGNGAALAAAALLFVGLWSPGFGGYWSRLQAEELLVLPELAAAWYAMTAVTRPRAAVACGVLTGVVGLYKVPAIAVGAAWLALWLASVPRREAAQRAGLFAIGLAVPWLAASAWFAAHGAFGVFVSSVLLYQRQWIAMIDPPFGDVLRELASTVIGELAPLLVEAAAGIVLLWRQERARAICLVVWIGATALAVVMQRQLAGYHFLLLVPGLAIAAGYGIGALGRIVVERTGTSRTIAIILLVAIAGLLVRSGIAWVRAYGGDDGYVRDQFAPADEQAVARYVAAHSRPSDGLLVWAVAPGIYALADRHPVTRFPFHRLLLTDSPLATRVGGRADRRAALLANLRTDRPAFVVIGTRDANSFEPQDGVASLVAWPELNSYVTSNYLEVARVGHFVVLGPRTGPTP